MKSRNLKLLAVAAVVACGASGATALAVPTSHKGGSEVRIDVRRDASPTTTRSLSYQTVPGALVDITVPSQGRLIVARFAAESSCAGPAPFGYRYCGVRIVARNRATGVITPLDPRPTSVYDSAFDTDGPGSGHDGSESNAMERSIRLPGGGYRISVQHAVTSPLTTFTLDDWHFAVEQNVAI